MPATIYNFDRYATQREIDEKIERCNEEAHSYFVKATQAQHDEYNAEMKAIVCIAGPAWERKRAAIKAKFREQTKEARWLCDRTFDCLMETGEVSEELDNEWTALIDLAQVARAMAAE